MVVVGVLPADDGRADCACAGTANPSAAMTIATGAASQILEGRLILIMILPPHDRDALRPSRSETGSANGAVFAMKNQETS